ncbi:Transcription-coupled repair protein CSA, contains WD40 domain [Plasmopara halstedii]|uniref:Transcription-coupled repair protein CSA, contains WD40 domain n=1 Tax=Plasmopara halstedii TaxID=4781 RepID=A0A0P1AL21_PLAHL|nr:Transcription-coupled repair protein CSA, contains WD40 domain [Plasmopara halstedii]CEG41558.1 Transcription-coupled repair protein CSA, contains WD40 domain [Plasmopara halstedii]|eukprot:XP_024577927.1 Transcription-coupled repair protein CSA, contains WD40 domain [Plasmopara halstedii]
MLDRSVGLPSRAYHDEIYSRQSFKLLQHPPSTSNYIFREGMRVWSMSLDPVEQRFLLVGTSRSQLLVFDLYTLDEVNAMDTPIYSVTNPFDPICVTQAKIASTECLQFGITMVDWYPVDSGLCLSSSLDNHVIIWDFETFTCVSSFNLNSKVFGAKFSLGSTTNSIIGAVTSKGEVRLIDMESGTTAHTLFGHQDEIWTLDWSPTSEFVLCTGSKDGELRLWDIRRSGATACLLCLNHEGKANVPGRSSLYTNVKNENPITLSTAAKARKRTRVDGADIIEARDRQRARTNIQEKLNILKHHKKRNDPHAAATSTLAIAHLNGITSLSYTPNGQFLVSLGMDQNLRLWNSSSGEHQFMNYEGIQQARLRAARNVQMAVFQEGNAWEGTLVITPNGSDGAISSYRVFGDSGRPLGTATAHYQQITACLYRQTMRELYSAGEDGLIMRWKPPPVDLYPYKSDDTIGINKRIPEDETKASIDAFNDEDAWSEDEGEETTAQSFIPPILRDEI